MGSRVAMKIVDNRVGLSRVLIVLRQKYPVRFFPFKYFTVVGMIFLCLQTAWKHDQQRNAKEKGENSIHEAKLKS